MPPPASEYGTDQRLTYYDRQAVHVWQLTRRNEQLRAALREHHGYNAEAGCRFCALIDDTAAFTTTDAARASGLPPRHDPVDPAGTS